MWKKEMLKLIKAGIILIIVMAIISLAFYGLTRTGLLGGITQSGPRQSLPQGQGLDQHLSEGFSQPGFPGGGPGQSRGPGEDDGNRPPASSMSGILENLLKICVIAAAVAIFQKIGRWIYKRINRRRTASQPEA
jgi:hypothetical protein